MINDSAAHRQYRPQEADALKRSRWLSYRRQKAWLEFLRDADRQDRQDQQQWQDESREADISREAS